MSGSYFVPPVWLLLLVYGKVEDMTSITLELSGILIRASGETSYQGMSCLKIIYGNDKMATLTMSQWDLSK